MTLRVMPSMMIDHFSLEFGMNAENLGILAGCYYLGYAIFQVPIGILLDKFHPRFVVSGCILVCVMGMILNIYASSKYDIYISRFLIGFGSIAGILGAVKSIDDFFPTKYSMFLGMTILLGVFGAVFGGVPISKSFAKFGIERTLLILVWISIVLAILILFLYRKSYSDRKEAVEKSVSEIIKLSILNKKLWIAGILGGMMVGPLGGFADMWASRYLEQIKGLEEEVARFATSMVFLGLGIGSTVVGYIATKVKSLTKFIGYMGISQLIIMSSLFFTDINSPVVIFTFMFLIGALCGYQVCVFSFAKKVMGMHMVGVATSLVNSLIMIFGFIFNFLVGKIFKVFFIEKFQGKLVYEEIAYQSAFSVILISILAGSIGFVLLSFNEKKLA
jgi:MFS family permease